MRRPIVAADVGGRHIAGSRAVAVRLRARAASNRVRESLFFIPTLLILCGTATAVGSGIADRSLQHLHVPHVLRVPAESANVLLATIAGATITTVGVVFSITVVSVQLASGQFSPRVVRGFFRDRYAQIVIGVLSATFAFCVLSLYGVSATVGQSPTQETPVLTTGIAVLLAFGSITTIVVYLDHSARALYVGRLADQVMEEAIALVRDVASGGGSYVEEQVPPGGAAHVVMSRGNSGWVQQVSVDGVLEAVPPKSVVRLETRPGAYVTTGTPIAAVWPPPPDADAVDIAINRAVILGAERTMQQDLDFGLRQLTDIALRALSPAVNDPTTAIEIIVRLGSILHELLATDPAPSGYSDELGRVLQNPLRLDHGDHIRHAFLQLRRSVVDHPLVAVAYLRTLRMLTVTARWCERESAADVAQQMIDGCLHLSERANLLDDERQMMMDAATAISPSGKAAAASSAYPRESLPSQALETER